MKGKIALLVGLGAGYVLGARAGRNRYNQIKKVAERIWNTPAVQAGTQQVSDFAAAQYDTVREVVGTKIGEAIAKPKKTSTAKRKTAAKTAAKSKTTAKKSTA